MKTAWLTLLASGLVTTLAATSCVIKEGPDTDTGGSGGIGTGGKATTGGASSNTGGRAATGGATGTGGASGNTGGKAATGGAKATGGATATGGAATVIGCDSEVDKFKSTPAASCDFQTDDLNDPVLGACLRCISREATCCDEIKNCYATSPDNQCGAGGLDGESEYLCYQNCLVTKAKARGGVYEDVDQGDCAETCVTPICRPDPLGDFTSDLVACMHANCDDECFVTPAQ